MNLSQTIAWLPFDRTTEDILLNNWTAYGNPTISSTNAKSGNALQLDGSSYLLSDDIELGGQDFCVRLWLYMDASSPSNARVCTIYNPDNNYVLLSIQRDGTNNSLKIWVNQNADTSQDYGYSCVANGGVGSWVFVQFVKYGTYNNISVGDSNQYTTRGAEVFNRRNYRISVGALRNGNQAMIGSIDEFAVEDGTSFRYQVSEITNDFYQKIIFNAKTSRKIKNAPLTWRYNNPGDASLLSGVTGTTVTGLDESASLTGEAFYQPTRTACFGVAATKEIWIRCDIYTTANYANNDRIRIYSEDANGINGWSTNATVTNNYSLWHNGTSQTCGTQGDNSYLGKGKRRSVLLHMKSDSSNGLIEFTLISSTGTKFNFSYKGNVNAGNDFANFYIQTDGSNIYVSNLIISNAELDINEGAQVSYIDTERLLTNTVELFFDTERVISHPIVELFFDVERKLQKEVTLTCDTQRNVVVTADYYVDLSRQVVKSVTLSNDLERELVRTEDFFCDLMRKIPHDISDTQQGILQSLTISLQEQQLTDNVSFVMAGDIDILDAVTFHAWDYILHCRAEETSKRGVLLSCKCTVDIDEILYQKMAYKIPSSAFEWTTEYNEAYAKYNYLHPTEQVEKMPSAPASAHITSIAGCIGKNVAIQFSDWISTMSTEVKSGTNYAGLIEELFGWTSRLPHLMINCYIRGNTLYAVQRGHENNVVTLDGQKLTVHTINKKIMRMTWGSDPNSNTDVEPLYRSWVSDDLTPFPEQEESGGGGEGTSTIGQNNLVSETEVNHGSERVVTQYKYQDMGGGQQFLYEEIQNTYIGGELIDHVVTTHKPVSYGQAQVYSTDDDGVLGSVVSPSNFDERITPYQYGQITSGGYSEAFVDGAHDEYGNYYTAVRDGRGNRYLITGHDSHKEQIGQRTRLNAYALVDTSFPVDGYDKLQYLTNQIEWLDRKTEESVTLDIYDYPHLIDFNDRIVWNGNTYFLRSNTAIKTETIVNKQTLEFVRWY